MGIGTADVPEEHHHYIASILFGGRHIRTGGLESATDSTKHVQFPRRGDVPLEVVEFDRNELDRSRCDGRNDSLTVPRGRGRCLDRRGQPGLHNASGGARLLDALERNFQIQVLAGRAFNERVQLRILKGRPPRFVRRGLRSRSPCWRNRPLTGNRHLRPRIVRSKHAACREHRRG